MAGEGIFHGRSEIGVRPLVDKVVGIIDISPDKHGASTNRRVIGV